MPAATLRQLVARRWRSLLRAGSWTWAGFGAAIEAVRQTGIDLPSQWESMGPWKWLIFSGPLILYWLCLRFPRIPAMISSFILPPPRHENPTRTFKGLETLGPNDTFPGRAAETSACIDKIVKSRFFVLAGESGCGKSSILAAAVLPALRTGRPPMENDPGRPPWQVVECRLADDPLVRLFAKLTGETGVQVTPEIVSAAIRTKADANPERPLLVVFDQAEEIIATVRDEVRTVFFKTLLSALKEFPNLCVLFAIRSDFGDRLADECRQIDPSGRWFDLRSWEMLQSFDRKKAVVVVRDLLSHLAPDSLSLQQRYQDFAEALTKSLLRPPKDPRVCKKDKARVLPAELQIVGHTIKRLRGADGFSAAEYRRLGSAAGVFHEFFEHAKDQMARVTGLCGEDAFRICRALISPSGTKWPRTVTGEGHSRAMAGGPAQTAQAGLDEELALDRETLTKAFRGGCPICS